MSTLDVNVLKVILIYEHKRVMRKKGFYALILLATLPPLIVMVAFKTMLINVKLYGEETLWAQLLGVQPGMLSIASITTLLWVIGVIFGGDLYASELEDRSIEMLLSKPTTRGHIFLGKALYLTLLLMGAYSLATLISIVVNLTVTLNVRMVHISPIIVLTLTLSTMGFAMLASLIGILVKKPTLAMILTIVIYYVLSIVSSLVLVFFVVGGFTHGQPYTATEPIRKLLIYQSYIPTYALMMLPQVVYAYLSGGSPIPLSTFTPIYFREILNVFKDILISVLIVSIVSTLVFTIVSYVLYRRIEV